jgi:diamine N-acetyltransferase
MAHEAGTLAIRPAAPADGAAIHALIGELADYEKLRHEVDASEADTAAALFGAHPRVFAEIAEWQGETAGFALWFYNYSTFRGRHGIYLEDLYVRPAWRGRGIGKALLARLAQRCVDEGLARLQWSVLDWNTPSIEFYASLGATPTPEWIGCRLEGAAIARLAASARSGAPNERPAAGKQEISPTC